LAYGNVEAAIGYADATEEATVCRYELIVPINDGSMTVFCRTFNIDSEQV
jgi:hypothetical protein